MTVISKMFDALGMDSNNALSKIQESAQLALDYTQTHPFKSAGIGLLSFIVWKYVITAPRNLPPGPRGVPLIGALDCLDYYGLAQKMLKWRKTYGEVISYYQFGKLYVVLNSDRVIREGLVKRADEFSSRYKDLTAWATVEGSDEIFAPDYSEKWKNDKKFAASSLKNYGFGTVRSESKINEQVDHLQKTILKSEGAPVNIHYELKVASAAVVCSLILGMEVTREDPEPAKAVELLSGWIGAMLGVFEARGVLGFIYPKAGALFSRKAEAAHAKIKRENQEFVRERIREAAKDYKDREPHSLIDAYLKERGDSEEVIEVVANNVIGFMADAIDTASNIMLVCCQYITHDPEIQERLYKEACDVIGSGRNPTLNDRSEMHFMQATLHEAIRVALPLQLSLHRILHRTIQFEGYTLPKGTLVAANNHAVNFDPEIFPDPFTFKPSRFIGADGKFRSDLASKLMSFSQGPRKCMGEGYFKVQSFFCITGIVQHFKMSFDPSLSKEDIDSKMDFITKLSFGTAVADIEICFTPR